MPSPTGSIRGSRPELPRRGRATRAQDRPEQVRTAALELFAAQGYRGTTVDQIGARVGIRGPSLYKHIRSKQELLAEIVVGATDALLAAQRAAVGEEGDVREQLRRAVEAHVRFHAEHPREAFVAGCEVDSLAEPHRADVLRKRTDYERRLRRLIETGVRDGAFAVESPRLAAYAILDMGAGVAGWFRPGRPVGHDELAALYGEFALRLVGPKRSTRRQRLGNPG